MSDSPKTGLSSFSRSYAAMWAVLLVGFVSTGLLIYKEKNWDHIYRNAVPNLRLVLSAKARLAEGHLWFEELMAGDATVNRDAVMELVNQASRDVKSLAAPNAFGAPRVIGHQQLQNELGRGVLELGQLLDNLTRLLENRWSNRATAKIGSESDQQFDQAFSAALEMMDFIKDIIDQHLNMARREQENWHEATLVVWIGVVLGASLATLLLNQNQIITQAALSEREQTLSTILKAAPIGIGRLKDDRFNWVNNRMAVITGWSREELSGAAVLFENEEAYLSAKAEMSAMIEEQGIGFVETTWRKKDGSRINVLIRAARLEQGDPRAGIVYTALDITEQKETENLVRQSEARFRSLVEQSPRPLAVYDASGQCRRTNPAWRELWSDVLADRRTGLPHFNPRGMPEPVRAAFEEALGGRPYISVEWLLTKKAPSAPTETDKPDRNITLILQTRSFPVKDHLGGTMDVAVVIEDVTQRATARSKREALIKELALKNAELEQYAYTVSHDLKNPLVTIQGFLGVLRQDALEGRIEDIDKDSALISAAASKMMVLLNNLLELTRIGGKAAAPETINLTDLVEKAVTRLREQAVMGAAEITIGSDMPSVTCDRERLIEVFYNLIENAVKFSLENAPIRIEILAHEAGDEVVCTVKDKGRGIERRYLDRIFMMFEQLDPSTPGSGVGLSLVKRIIQTHGGVITAESEGLGKGTTIKFTLPRAEESRNDIHLIRPHPKDDKHPPG